MNVEVEAKVKMLKRGGEPIIDIEISTDKEGCRLLLLNKYKINGIEIPHKRIRGKIVLYRDDEYSRIWGNIRYHHMDFLILQIPKEWFELDKRTLKVKFQLVIEQWVKRIMQDFHKNYKNFYKYGKHKFKKDTEKIRDILIESIIEQIERTKRGRLRKEGLKVMAYINLFINTGDILSSLIRITKDDEKKSFWVLDLSRTRPIYSVNPKFVAEICEMFNTFINICYPKILSSP